MPYYGQCNKIGYANRKQAKKKAAKIQNKSGGKRMAAYKCDFCDFYHLTSYTARQREEYREHFSKDKPSLI